MNISNQKGVPFGTSIATIKIPEILLQRVPTGLDYIDAVYGGHGLIPTSVTLFTGTPGAGKTTMMLLTANGLVSRDSVVVFNTREESVYQIKMHSERLKLKNPFLVSEESLVQDILKKCDEIKQASPKKHFVLIIDSLQTLTDDLTGVINSSTSVRCLEMITSWCKNTNAIAIVIGQVGKDGNFTGKNALPHMVDSYLTLSIETSPKSSYSGCRVLEMEKHRFGKSHTQIYLKTKNSGFSIVGMSGDPDDF